MSTPIHSSLELQIEMLRSELNELGKQLHYDFNQKALLEKSMELDVLISSYYRSRSEASY